MHANQIFGKLAFIIYTLDLSEYSVLINMFLSAVKESTSTESWPLMA